MRFILFIVLSLMMIPLMAKESYLLTLKKIQALTYIPYFPINQSEESCLIQDICIGQSIMYAQLKQYAIARSDLAVPKSIEDAVKILESAFAGKIQNKTLIPGIKEFSDLPFMAPYSQAWSIVTKKIQANLFPLKFAKGQDLTEENKRKLEKIQKILKQSRLPIILLTLKLNSLFNYYHPLIVIKAERSLGGGRSLQVLDPKSPEKYHTLEIDAQGKVRGYSWWMPTAIDQENLKYYETIMSSAWLEILDLNENPYFDPSEMSKSIFLEPKQLENLKKQCLKDYLCNLAFSYLQSLLQKNALFTQTKEKFLNYRESKQEIQKAILNRPFEISGVYNLPELLVNPYFFIGLMELAYQIKSSVFDQYDDTFYTEYFSPEKTYEKSVRFKLGDKASLYNLRELGQMKAGNSKMLGLHYIKSSLEPLHLSYPILSVKNWNLGDKRWELKVLDKDFSVKTLIVNDDGSLRETDITLFQTTPTKETLAEIFISSIKTYYYAP